MKSHKANISTTIHSQDNLSGIVYMSVGIVTMVLMDAVAKLLVSTALTPLQLIGLRSWIIVSLLFAYYFFSQQLSQLKPNRIAAQYGRGVLGFLAPFCFFTSLKTLPLADATVIFFSSIFMITALSWPLLKEKVGVHRWSAVVIGFVGVVIAMDPQGGGDALSYFYCLVASLAYALLFVTGRILSKTETVISLVFSFNLALAVVCTVLMPLVWVSVSGELMLKVFGFALLAMTGHICMTIAFSRTAVSILAPLEYTALIWASLFGYLIWGNIPSNRMMMGATIVILCGLYVIHREARKTGQDK